MSLGLRSEQPSAIIWLELARLVREAGDLALATNHLAQSSSASRFTAEHAGFFILSQSGERPER
jgi:hypothetical protein